MSDENPEPWDSEHPQKENWPPKTGPDGVRTALIVLGVIAVIIGIIFVGCMMYLNTALH